MTTKYFQSENGKLKVEKDHWFLKSKNGEERELPFPSKVASDIIIENSPISKAQYDE